MSDTAEYWWGVKNRSPYMGKEFKHHPKYACSHIRPVTGNTVTTPYINDINCYECIEEIKRGNIEGLIEGKAPEDFYLTKSGKKAFRKQKAFNDKYGFCPCGSTWTIRKNSKNNTEFLGCLQYPKCKNTKSINPYSKPNTIN